MDLAVERKLIREHKRRVQVSEFLHRETERAGFGGADIQRTPMGVRINLVAERPGFVIGRRGATIKKLTEDLSTRFDLDNPQVEVTEDANPALNPQIMAMKLAEALERGWHFRRAGHSTLRRIRESGARGALIQLSGKVTGGRSRVEKFVSGHIKYCGDTALNHMHKGFAVAKKKLGVIGVTVAIMDPNVSLPDEISVATDQARPEPGAVRGEASTPEAAAPAEAEAGATPATGGPQEDVVDASGAPGAATAGPEPTSEVAEQVAPGASAEEAAAETAAAPAEAPAGGAVQGDLTDLDGVGQKKADALVAAGYKTLKDLNAASLDELAAVEGIGSKLAKKIKDELKRMEE